MIWFRSKVDWWLVPLLCVAPGASVFAVADGVVRGDGRELMTGVIAMGITAVVYLGLVFPVRYGIGEGKLVVRFGLCRQSIPLEEIREVHRTRSPISSPALSLDRLRVRYGEGMFKAVMISPADREGFLRELGDRAGLVMEGEGLVRV